MEESSSSLSAQSLLQALLSEESLRHFQLERRSTMTLEEVLADVLEQEAEEGRRSGTYASLQHASALATVLKRPVRLVYPDVDRQIRPNAPKHDALPVGPVDSVSFSGGLCKRHVVYASDTDRSLAVRSLVSFRRSSFRSGGEDSEDGKGGCPTNKAAFIHSHRLATAEKALDKGGTRVQDRLCGCCLEFKVVQRE